MVHGLTLPQNDGESYDIHAVTPLTCIDSYIAALPSLQPGGSLWSFSLLLVCVGEDIYRQCCRVGSWFRAEGQDAINQVP